MRIYFDSSALVKRYIHEDGSELVLQWCDKASELITSAIAVPEVISAFSRLRRDGEISALQYRRLKQLLLGDIAHVAQVPLSEKVLTQTIASLEHSPLRGMDAIHVGSALVLQVDMFLSSDNRQTAAAIHAGLSVVSV